MNNPAIVITAYNRPNGLSRLLKSVATAHYHTDNIPLIISIDKNDKDEVYEIADSFDWKFGEKKVIQNSEHLGLKEHFLRCGDLTSQYERIVLLEDDLIVSPWFYKYSTEAARFFCSDRSIAGISLYAYQIAENGFFPFYPHNDGSDVYFMQLPSSWGEIITVSSWESFRHWNEAHLHDFPKAVLPGYIQNWPEHSWKKWFAAYLISSNRYFVYPRLSYSTNYGDPGVNTDRKGLFQVPLLYADRENIYVNFSESASVYDSSFEIVPRVLKKLDSKFNAYDFGVDMHSTKSLDDLTQEFILSSRKCNHPLFSFGNDLPDPVQNVLSENQGEFYSFGKKADFEPSSRHVFDFYTNLTSITDIVMSQHISHFEFNQKYPKLFIGIVHDGHHQELEETLRSIYIQSYPISQLQIVIFNLSKQELKFNEKYKEVEVRVADDKDEFIESFSCSANSSNVEYFVTMRSGDVFHNHVFEAVNTIFKRYPDLHWLTGIETIRSETGYNVFYGNTAMRRWNQRIYERNLYKNSLRYIPPAATFWRKHLWNTAKADLNFVSLYNFYEDIWLGFFKSQKLYTCDVYFSSSPLYNTPKLRHSKNLIEYSLIEDTWINRLQEFFFINNFPYLRVYYKVKNSLAEVIRLDHEGQWYFQSDF